jgi:hypothetical protein
MKSLLAVDALRLVAARVTFSIAAGALSLSACGSPGAPRSAPRVDAAIADAGLDAGHYTNLLSIDGSLPDGYVRCGANGGCAPGDLCIISTSAQGGCPHPTYDGGLCGPNQHAVGACCLADPGTGYLCHTRPECCAAESTCECAVMNGGDPTSLCNDHSPDDVCSGAATSPDVISCECTTSY